MDPLPITHLVFNEACLLETAFEVMGFQSLVNSLSKWVVGYGINRH